MRFGSYGPAHIPTPKNVPAGPIHEHFANTRLNLLEVPGHHLPEPVGVPERLRLDAIDRLLGLLLLALYSDRGKEGVSPIIGTEGLSRIGASRSTTCMSIAILSEIRLATDQPREMLRGEISLPRPAAPQGIDQAQALIEFGVGSGCGGCRWIQRLEGFPPGLTLGVGPDGNRVEAGVDQVGEWRRGVGRRHAPRLAAPDGWKSIPGAMQDELQNGVMDWQPVGPEEPGDLRPLHRRMSLRLAQVERGGQLVVGERASDDEFQRDDEVVGFELHATSIRSLFANREYL